MPRNATEMRRRAGKLRDQATKLMLEAEMWEQAATRLDAIGRRAPSRHVEGEVPHGDPTPQRGRASLPQGEDQRRTKISKAKNQNQEHPFVKAAIATHGSVNEWAKKHGKAYTSVQSWLVEGKHGRSIPADVAIEIANELGVPADESVWRNGIQKVRR